MNESSELTVIDPKSVEATSFSVRVHSEPPMKAYCCTQASRTTGLTGLALREKFVTKTDAPPDRAVALRRISFFVSLRMGSTPR